MLFLINGKILVIEQVLGVVCVMARQGSRTTGAQAVVWTTVVTLVLSKKLTESFTITADLVFAFASFSKSELEIPADLLKKFKMGQTNYFAQKKKKRAQAYSTLWSTFIICCSLESDQVTS